MYLLQIQRVSRNNSTSNADGLNAANDGVCSISLEDAFSGDSELCSQTLPDVPDLLNSSMETLQKMAGFSNHDSLIFPD